MATIKYFGMLAEATGLQEERIALEPQAVSALKQLLLEKHPALMGKDFRIAVNQELGDDNRRVSDSTEIALLPPFSGG